MTGMNKPQLHRSQLAHCALSAAFGEGRGVSYELSDRMNYEYVLNMKNGKLIAEKRKFMQEELIISGELVFKDGTIQIQPDETD